MSRKKTSTRKKKKSRKSNNNLRVILIVSCFIVILFSTIYYLGHLKNSIETATVPQATSPVDIQLEISRIDRSISHVLFNLGVSRNDIRTSSVTTKTSGNTEWTYKEKTITADRSELEIDDIETELAQIASNSSTKATFRKDSSSIVFDITVNDLRTHRIEFNLRDEVSAKVRTAKRDIDPYSGKDKPGTGTKDKATDELFDIKKGKIVIIVDDLGMDKKTVDSLTEISTDLTLAVLPNLPNSLYAAEVAKKKNMDLLLHLPMEPKTISGYNADDAGEGVLLVGQTKQDIVASLEKNIVSVPDAIGVNNHMGSKFTENDELMELVLKKLKERGLFFVDSLTSPNSRGYPIAREIGLKTAKRDYFLDDKKKGKEYVVQQLAKLVDKSEREGIAVGICHPYPQTIEAFRQVMPDLKKRVDIVPVSKVLN